MLGQTAPCAYQCFSALLRAARDPIHEHYLAGWSSSRKISGHLRIRIDAPPSTHSRHDTQVLARREQALLVPAFQLAPRLSGRCKHHQCGALRSIRLLSRAWGSANGSPGEQGLESRVVASTCLSKPAHEAHREFQLTPLTIVRKSRSPNEAGNLRLCVLEANKSP